MKIPTTRVLSLAAVLALASASPALGQDHADHQHADQDHPTGMMHQMMQECPMAMGHMMGMMMGGMMGSMHEVLTSEQMELMHERHGEGMRGMEGMEGMEGMQRMMRGMMRHGAMDCPMMQLDGEVPEEHPHSR